jgi:hypothetical protein
VLWVFAFGALLGLALLAWQRRFLLVAGATAVVTVGAPLLFETLQADQVGFFWQGRYSMPIALGVPVLLAMSVATRRPRPDIQGMERLVGAIAIAVVVAQVAAFGQALRRNTVGYNGALDFLVHPDWKPPLPAWLLTVLYLVVVSAFAWWVTSRTPETRGEPESTPSGSLRYS